MGETLKGPFGRYEYITFDICLHYNTFLLKKKFVAGTKTY